MVVVRLGPDMLVVGAGCAGCFFFFFFFNLARSLVLYVRKRKTTEIPTNQPSRRSSSPRGKTDERALRWLEVHIANFARIICPGQTGARIYLLTRTVFHSFDITRLSLSNKIKKITIIDVLFAPISFHYFSMILISLDRRKLIWLESVFTLFGAF